MSEYNGEPDGPEGLTVLSIVSRWIPSAEPGIPGRSILSVDLASATEMHFEVALEPGDDYDDAIAAICKLAPHLMRLDADLTEAYDDGFRTQPRREDLIAVQNYVTRWHGRLQNSNVAAGAFDRVTRTV
jgi:hypothetical protein